MEDEPVIVLQGPRSVGKSTLLRAIAAERGRDVVDLDDEVVRDAAEVQANLIVSGAPPVFVDEFQRVPALLDAIKAELNRSSTAARFVLAGSASYASLPRAAQSLTGRLHQLTIWPLSQGEIAGLREEFVERLMDDPASVVGGDRSTTTRADYVERVTAGGLPLSLRRSPGAGRSRWYAGYVRQVIDRDVIDLSKIRQRDRMPRIFARLASQTGQVANISKLSRDADLEQKTAEAYVALLEAVFMIHRLPGWGRNLRSRSAAAPKIHMVDTGVAAHLLRLTPDKLNRATPTALTEFGHLLETFAVNEILKQVSWHDEHIEAGHWRTHDGDEVDLVLEGWDGRIVGVEVKAAERLRREDVRGLAKLRDALGDEFIGGVLLMLGGLSYTIEDRIHVVPLDRLWTAF